MGDHAIFRPEWLEFETELGFRPLLLGPTYQDLLEQYKHNLFNITKKYGLPQPDLAVTVSGVTTSTGVRLKIYRPPNLKPNQPIVCYFHGGGLVLGTVEEDDVTVRRYAKETGLIFVSVDYKLAPYDPYPAGFGDCIDAAEWCIDHAAEYEARAAKVLLMGVSAGATLALAAALNLISHRKIGQLQGVVAVQPVTIHPEAVPVEIQHKYKSFGEHDGRSLYTKSAMRTLLELHGAPRNDPFIFPAFSRLLKKLPCVYLAGCDVDTLRDDARIFKDLLDDDQVLYVYDEYEGLPHCFFAYPSRHLDSAREEYFRKTAAGVRFVIESSEVTALPSG
ncbi:Putative alpha/beta hydrolase-3 [Septoria linicola]|uniref:Alpha/beta hydrolase-3 n=1 Tax=Septoria linicola TaxID=215465 RepID=A0A9Q9B367_9PEZI|nr:putative alpha/beta hydrolase-3 [Septoria linicola]USW55496.1 Putative alpha/beta hydrolase-3 [Septoria linicola]